MTSIHGNSSPVAGDFYRLFMRLFVGWAGGGGTPIVIPDNSSRRLLHRAGIINAGTGRQVAVVAIADTPWARMVGLLGRGSLDPGDGLMFDPCRTIHTWFMRFPIDVLFVGERGDVIKTVERLEPFHWAWGGLATRITIELSPGAVRSVGIAAGDRILIERQDA
jgi:uncharacterized membrane protein (UPF0127 family)